jgi:formylmethanofuran dehydrogenase subunit E
MQSVRMYTDGNGVSWAMSKCSVCGEVHKYLTEIVLTGHVACKSCHHNMELDRALIETDERKQMRRV